MLNFLVSLNLLPATLPSSVQPEIELNQIGDPYQLRAKALDHALSPFELGRVMLHLVQRRGFQSNRKTLLGDMVDDPDALSVLAASGLEQSDKELTEFKQDIEQLRQTIRVQGYRTLGEYLNSIPARETKRNRQRDGSARRTDRQMYSDEFWQIIESQSHYHPTLLASSEGLFEVIFFQRPLSLKKNRVGKCTLEPKLTRAKKAWCDFQRFRYLQDINNLAYFDKINGDGVALNDNDRGKLVQLFDRQEKVTVTAIKKCLGLNPNAYQLNCETRTKQFKGNTTATTIRAAMPRWDGLTCEEQSQLEVDLISYEKKSALKKRLMEHWQCSSDEAFQLCVAELEPEHADLSLKAIRKLLPYLEAGMIYADARVAAGYIDDPAANAVCDKLGTPPDLTNPIVSKGLYEVKRVVNAIIKQYGKPCAIRLTMARDLEMNTKHYASFIKQQKQNKKLDQEAQAQFEAHCNTGEQPDQPSDASWTDRLKYRLWKEQNQLCAYSLNPIALTQLFSRDTEVGHIIPYSINLNDSYMNKVVCFSSQNQTKGAHTPIEAFGKTKQWDEITSAINRWHPTLGPKRNAYHQTLDAYEPSFESSQLFDTRYISKSTQRYLQTLGVDVSPIKGHVISWLRHLWGMNSLVDTDTSENNRSDFRHHAIDAAVTACVDQSLYNSIVSAAKKIEQHQPQFHINNIALEHRFPAFKQQVRSRLETVIIAHATQRKVAGAFHQQTGIGFNETTGAVYRKNLDISFTQQSIKKIIDPVVRGLVINHIDRHGGDIKLAFAPGFFLAHKDGKTPIKRVRIQHSKATLEQMQANKIGVTDKRGSVFKWMTPGNEHHVAVYKKNGEPEYKADFVPVYRAYQNVMRGATAFGDKSMEGYEFQYGLHKNDLVMVMTAKDDLRFTYYRIVNIQPSNNRILLTEHTNAKSKRIDTDILTTVSNLLLEHYMKRIEVNAIGQLTHDPTSQ